MTDGEARRFGQEQIRFGKHKGHRIDAIPLDYLTWLADGRDEFVQDLRRYCRSRRVQTEMETPDE